MTAQPLGRPDAPRPPIRIVHLGLGAFHRAHQAWYTAQADPEGSWGIAAFTGRSPDAAAVLGAQDGLYTLIQRGADGDRLQVISSIVRTHDASETSALRALLSRSEVTVVTLTVTEKGYRLDPNGVLDSSDADVAGDAESIRQAIEAHAAVADGALLTMPGRLLWGLLGRADSGAGPIAVISCDNLDHNGRSARSAVLGLAARISPDLVHRIDVDWIDTSVDRITPKVTAQDIAEVEARTGRHDLAPVVTEPYTSWILSGGFRAERPRWERAGAVVVDDLAPFARRKLWLLNGAHSLLAYAGLTRGHETVAAAIGDPECAALVEGLWDLDARHLRDGGAELDLDGYRDALISRFSNPAIAHRLSQIAVDGSVKLRSRVVDVILLDRADGGDGDAGLRVLAEWIRHVRAEHFAGNTLDDASAVEISARVTASAPASALIEIVSPLLAADGAAMSRVEAMLDAPAPPRRPQ